MEFVKVSDENFFDNRKNRHGKDAASIAPTVPSEKAENIGLRRDLPLKERNAKEE